jgi:hypothetical protein
MNLDEQYIHLYENTYEIKNIVAGSLKNTDKSDTNKSDTNNFVESEEEYEITNDYVSPTCTEQLSDSSISETNSE